ncbi:NfeD family protein [Streptomyces sp. NPDC017524]|uniref:NfeD family protein n=1 Tax=Streptomyces sp. NPDC017524 TaxID=3364999 RepID=UPI003791E88E
MTIFLGLGIAGIVLLALSLIFGGILEGLFDGLFDGLLSLPVIAGFLSMLGFGGAIVLGSTSAGTLVATAIGVAAGLVAAWLTWKLSKALMRDQTDATPRGSDLIGTSGSVVTAIPAEGYGEVLLRLGGQPVKYAAKSAAPVARGTEIWVEEALSTTSVAVRPVER